MLNKPLTLVVVAVALSIVGSSVTGCSGGGGGGTGGGSGGGSGGSGGAGGGGTVTVDQACTDFANAYCDKIDSCFPFVMTISYGDKATCASRGKLQCAARAASNGTGVTAAAVESCVSAVGGVSCTDVLDGVNPAACRFKGTLTNGTACGDDSQCSSGFCNISSGSCGACASVIASGGACTNGGCDTGLVCAGGVCKTPGSGGDACGVTPCKTSLVCKAGTCVQPQTTAGASCTPAAADCQTAKALYCNSNSVCANIATAAAGDSCGLVAGTVTLCKASGACKGAGVTPGTCAAPKADGATCATDDTCLPPATCTGGVCKLPSPSSCM